MIGAYGGGQGTRPNLIGTWYLIEAARNVSVLTRIDPSNTAGQPQSSVIGSRTYGCVKTRRANPFPFRVLLILEGEL